MLWIRNTVDEAQQTYRQLRGARCEGKPAIALLHARFPFFRRERLEDEWMTRLGKDASDRPSGCVLVSTQVAEQSVDIDSDLLITDLAPTDMMLQRLSRLWRHARPSRPCSHPKFGYKCRRSLMKPFGRHSLRNSSRPLEGALEFMHPTSYCALWNCGVTGDRSPCRRTFALFSKACMARDQTLNATFRPRFFVSRRVGLETSEGGP